MVDRPIVTYRFKNYGKTPAIITQIWGRIVQAETPPDTQTHFAPEQLPAEFVIAPGAASEPKDATIIGDFRIGLDEYKALQQGNLFWFFFGQVRYDDILGMEHIHDFCWRWDASLNSFDPIPHPPERNYTEYREHPGRYRKTGRFHVSEPPP